MTTQDQSSSLIPELFSAPRGTTGVMMGQGHPSQNPPGWHGVVQSPFLLGALLAHKATMSLLRASPSRRRWLPAAPNLTCHSWRWPQSCWKWCKSRLCPCWGWDIWLKSVSPEGDQRPQHPHPGMAPTIYPKTT